MYYPGQIVFDLDAKKPFIIGNNVWDKNSYPKRHTHFIKSQGHIYEIALPKTIKEAIQLLDKNLIVPAPCPPSHCWKCGDWKENCMARGKCKGAST